MPMLQGHFEQQEEADPVVGSKLEDLKHEDPTRDTDLHLSRKLSEESIRTELCDGPVPDSPPRPRTPEQYTTTCSDRAELIERLKRGESPTWIPSRHLGSLYQQTAPRSPTGSPKPLPSRSPTLLPPPTITPEKPDTTATSDEAQDRLQEGLDIERPRSALHSGDFRHDESSHDTRPTREPLRDVTDRHRSWLATSPPRDFALDFERRSSRIGFPSAASSLSSSLSQSFAYMPPTSPLVQSESNDDIVDLSLPMDNIDIATGRSKYDSASRRHTLHFYPPSPYSTSTLSRHLTPSRENSHPYQAHQPRRSLTSPFSFNPASAPQTPGHNHLQTRRQSISSDASPMLHASMVGSYEESILRGRMSTTPSRPLDFQAEIGVLGLGKCKPSLKCPAHVTIPFSAVFYSYASTTHAGRTASEDGPSPYVGQIDLENGLANPEDGQRAKRKMHARYPDGPSTAGDDIDMEAGAAGRATDREARLAKRKRSRSPKAPPGGSYRIPQQGMLQIIIKNQNKTAVKLFLVRYDLAGMEPGTKTFIRQRSYSDPDDATFASSSTSTSTHTQPILRYLIQLHICCPAKGRYYLYKSIRVVFANRVPDGKEKLRNEVGGPEPRFSPYKGVRAMAPPVQGSSLAAEKAWRRRSAGWSFGAGRGEHDVVDGVAEGFLSSPTSLLAADRGRSDSLGGTTGSGHNDTVDAVPLSLTGGEGVVSGSTSETSDEMRDSGVLWPQPVSDQVAVRLVQRIGWDEGESDGRGTRYGKLSKGDAGYGGTAASAAMEGLLARSLRSLGVQSPGEAEG